MTYAFALVDARTRKVVVTGSDKASTPARLARHLRKRMKKLLDDSPLILACWRVTWRGVPIPFTHTARPLAARPG